jgi:hypothetical protein
VSDHSYAELREVSQQMVDDLKKVYPDTFSIVIVMNQGPLNNAAMAGFLPADGRSQKILRRLADMLDEQAKGKAPILKG